jgi:hypothetical protein
MPRTPTIFGISMASKTSRRWLVLCCYAVLLTLTVLVFSSISFAARYVLMIVMTSTAMAIQFVIFYKLAKDTVLPLQVDFRPIGLGLSRNLPPNPTKLDERQVAVRNEAYYKAYRIFAAYSLLMPIILTILTNPLNKNLLGIYMVSTFFTIYTLPQAVILWTEPDIPPEAV